MVTYKHGDIFTSTMQTIVNPVNTVGVMGKGLALQFKKRYPDAFNEYWQLCDSEEFIVGKLHLHKKSRYILHFPTKEHWRDDSNIDILEVGLRKLVDQYKQQGITSIAFPLLGAGCGNIPADEVMLIMEKHLMKLDIPVEIWRYG